jgi:Ca-activated chloride channel family protein
MKTTCFTFSFRPRLYLPLSCVLCISWLLILLSPGVSAASPSSALRDYKAGQYDAALKEYQRLLERKTDDPRLRFNAGAAAFRDRKFDEAAKQFDEALASPQTASDLKLQGQAYYNRGSSLYQLGESIPDPTKKTETWQRSMKDFETSMNLSKKLNSPDADAQFNYDFVKRKLEELKQQQQDKSDKQQNQGQNQDQNQQQQQQQNQSKQDQDQKQQQQQQQQQQQNQSDQKQDSAQQKQEQSQQNQQQAQQQKEEQKQQQQAAQKSEEQKQQQASQASGKPEENPDEKEPQTAYAPPDDPRPGPATA